MGSPGPLIDPLSDKGMLELARGALARCAELAATIRAAADSQIVAQAASEMMSLIRGTKVRIGPDGHEARAALRFYAETKNYIPTGWQGDMDPSPVARDRGEKARAALGLDPDTIDGEAAAPQIEHQP